MAQILDKRKLEVVFGKIYVFGFLLFLTGFLVFAGYTSIRDKNYSLLVLMIPFCLGGFFLIRNRLLGKEREKSEKSLFTFAFIISTLLVAAALLAGIFFLIWGIKDADAGLMLGGVIFTFGSLTFVLAALTCKGCFERAGIDVFGVYAGAVITIIGIGFLVLMRKEPISSCGVWIIIPILMIVAGIYQVVKCIRNRGHMKDISTENGERDY